MQTWANSGIKPNQTKQKPNQAKPSQAKPSQAKPSQANGDGNGAGEGEVKVRVRVMAMAMVEVLVNPDCDVCELCGSGAVCRYGLGTHVSYRHVQVRDWVVASQHGPTKPA